MLLVDTSVWIDYFRKPNSPSAQTLDQTLGNIEIVIGDLILVELLQGLREGPQLKLVRASIASFRIVDLCGPDIASKAAANYRSLRQSGLTIRGTIDVIIATWCIENGVSLLHNDRDFTIMEQRLGLSVWR
ncbi:MAG: PIN domain nuclease [Pseudaminobacter sp.]|nr:PIN domain nuclease [Pseudaminobacter sp.]